ncbi:hypothetical protein BLOT_005355 [Blomia tropicalis]|nr:hypothetical protein BLOT_005355 [Blomia tropicalis]
MNVSSLELSLSVNFVAHQNGGEPLVFFSGLVSVRVRSASEALPTNSGEMNKMLHEKMKANDIEWLDKELY